MSIMGRLGLGEVFKYDWTALPIYGVRPQCCRFLLEGMHHPCLRNLPEWVLGFCRPRRTCQSGRKAPQRL